CCNGGTRRPSPVSGGGRPAVGGAALRRSRKVSRATILGLNSAGFAVVPALSRTPPEVTKMPQLARRIGRAKPSAIMQIAEKAKRLKSEGRDIISFSIGVPNFLPGEHVYQAARDALSHDSGQYGSNR